MVQIKEQRKSWSNDESSLLKALDNHCFYIEHLLVFYFVFLWTCYCFFLLVQFSCFFQLSWKIVILTGPKTLYTIYVYLIYVLLHRHLTPLHIATLNGHCDIVKFLIEKGVGHLLDQLRMYNLLCSIICQSEKTKQSFFNISCWQ